MSSASFVGRASEIAILNQALARAGAGEGGVVLLVGEPGIGKTRLADEFATRARAAGAEVLSGRCYEGPGAPAFWPWTQVVRAYAGARDAHVVAGELGPNAADVAAVVPELQERFPDAGVRASVADDQARFRLFDAVTRALVRAGEPRPVVVVLEDLHGADRASLLLLEFLAREIRRARLVVVGTLRDAALAPGQPMAGTVAELVRERVGIQVPLRGLEPDEVAELLERLAGTRPSEGLVRSVHRRTDGNPLYVRELLPALLDGSNFVSADAMAAISDSVRLTIARHVEALTPAARRTLTVAALFGREFRLEVVARTTETSAEQVLAHVDEAVRARLVERQRDVPGRYRFVHALFAESLVDELGELARIGLHRRAAAALASQPGADDLVPEIAHHWFAAGPGGDPEQAVEWAERAALRASDMLAHEEAADWYRRALAALAWTDRDRRERQANLLLGLGEAEKRAGVDAKPIFEKAAALARALGSAALLTRAALGSAPAQNYGDHITPDPGVVALLEEAIAAWKCSDSALHARALARLAMALVYGDADRRTELLAQALAMTRRLADSATLCHVLAARLFASRQGSPVERRALSDELVRNAAISRDPEALTAGRLWRCVHFAEYGEAGAFDAELASFAELASRLGQPMWRWYVCLVRGMRHALAGDLAAMERAIEEALAIGQPTMPFAAPAYYIGQMFFLKVLRGDFGFVSQYRSMFENHPDPGGLSPLLWAESESGQGISRSLVDRLVADDFFAVRHSIGWDLACVFMAEAHEALTVDEAREVYGFLTPLAGFWSIWAQGAVLGPFTHHLGLLARRMRRLDDGVAHLRDAVESARRAGARMALARALYELGIILGDRDSDGDAAIAAASLAESRALATDIGLGGLLRKLDALGVTDGGAARASAPARDGAAFPDDGRRHSPSACRREGDYWTIEYGGAVLRLRGSRGMEYLAQLLWHPRREFHVGELVALAGGQLPRAGPIDPGARVAADLGDAGAVLDATAQHAYRARVAELRAELDEAERTHDGEGASRLREELDAVAHELRSAGRGRKAAAHTERARVAVTKTLKSAIDKIKAVHPALGRHLAATVKRGYRCVYVPDPRHPIEWTR